MICEYECTPYSAHIWDNGIFFVHVRGVVSLDHHMLTLVWIKVCLCTDVDCNHGVSMYVLMLEHVVNVQVVLSHLKRSLTPLSPFRNGLHFLIK